jgi:hypothetical protein
LDKGISEHRKKYDAASRRHAKEDKSRGDGAASGADVPTAAAAGAAEEDMKTARFRTFRRNQEYMMLWGNS